MPTVTAPNLTNSGTYLDRIGDLLLDTARFRLIDIERPEDDNNVPDYTDVRTGASRVSGQNSTGGNFSGGPSPWQMAGWALAAFVGFKVLKSAKVI